MALKIPSPPAGFPTTESVTCVPRLFVPLSVWQKLHAYVGACPVEINGFGLLEPHGFDLMVTDVFITDQTVGPAHADVDPMVLAAYMTECIRQGIDTSKMRLQWHSHVNMQAYFSGVDTNNIDRYAGEWMISMVLNKAGQFEARLDTYRPFRSTAPIEVVVLVPSDSVLDAQVHNEIAAKVKTVGILRKRPVESTTPPATTASDGSRIIVYGTPETTVSS